MTKEEEVLLKSKMSEEDFNFVTMLMDHTQTQIDALRESLMKAKDEDERRLKEMSKRLDRMINYHEKVVDAVTVAEARLPSDVYHFLYSELFYPFLDVQMFEIAEAKKELRIEKERFDNGYKSLK